MPRNGKTLGIATLACLCLLAPANGQVELSARVSSPTSQLNDNQNAPFGPLEAVVSDSIGTQTNVFVLATASASNNVVRIHAAMQGSNDANEPLFADASARLHGQLDATRVVGPLWVQFVVDDLREVDFRAVRYNQHSWEAFDSVEDDFHLVAFGAEVALTNACEQADPNFDCPYEQHTNEGIEGCDVVVSRQVGNGGEEYNRTTPCSSLVRITDSQLGNEGAEISEFLSQSNQLLSAWIQVDPTQLLDFHMTVTGRVGAVESPLFTIEQTRFAHLSLRFASPISPVLENDIAFSTPSGSAIPIRQTLPPKTPSTDMDYRTEFILDRTPAPENTSPTVVQTDTLNLSFTREWIESGQVGNEGPEPPVFPIAWTITGSQHTVRDELPDTQVSNYHEDQRTADLFETNVVYVSESDWALIEPVPPPPVMSNRVEMTHNLFKSTNTIQVPPHSPGYTDRFLFHDSCSLSFDASGGQPLEIRVDLPLFPLVPEVRVGQEVIIRNPFGEAFRHQDDVTVTNGVFQGAHRIFTPTLLSGTHEIVVTRSLDFHLPDGYPGESTTTRMFVLAAPPLIRPMPTTGPPVFEASRLPIGHQHFAEMATRLVDPDWTPFHTFSPTNPVQRVTAPAPPGTGPRYFRLRMD